MHEKWNFNEMKRNIAEDALNLLNEKGIAYDCSKELEAINNQQENEYDIRLKKRLMALLEYYDKLIPSIPRKVIYSSELKAKITNLPIDVENEVKRFETLFTNGEDVNNHLSKTVFNLDKKAYAFQLWGIKHLHLSAMDTQFEESAMNNRSRWLLFAIVNKDAAYFS